MDFDPMDRKMLRDRIAVLASLLRNIEQNAREGTGPSVGEHPRYALLQQMHDRLMSRLPE